MSIIISKNLKNAVKVDRSSFALEDNLQQYIYDNPESIPLYDIKEDIKLLILAREFPTASGPIDAIGVDKDGEIYLIETKLYRNPDKRTVVAQVLDYGASLWKTYTNYEVFLSQLDTRINQKFNKTLQQRVQEFFGMEEEQLNQFNENLRDNLNDGNFKFVVLMDQIHSQLKDLIIFINQNSRFNIYGVELEYYKYNSYEILIPKLFGAEVKKEVGVKKPSKAIPTDDEFISAYKQKALDKKIKEVLSLYNDIREERIKITGLTVSKSPKFINLYYSPSKEKGSIKATISFSLGINPDFEGGGFQIWCDDKEEEKKAREVLKHNLNNINLLKKIKGTFGKIAKWPLENFSAKELQSFFIEMSQ
jgi:hypothetical protein